MGLSLKRGACQFIQRSPLIISISGHKAMCKVGSLALFWVLTCFNVAWSAPEAEHNADSADTPQTRSVTCQRAGVGAPPFNLQFSLGSVPTFPELTSHVGPGMDVISGNLYQHELVYRSSLSGLAFVRHYNSLSSDCQSHLGAGWRHSYQVSLSIDNDRQVSVQQSDGRTIRFFLKSNADDKALTYHGSIATDGYLVLGDRSVWHLPNGRQFIFRDGRLVEIGWAGQSRRLSLSYEADKLVSVKDGRGETLAFHYATATDSVKENEPDLLTSLVLPNGGAINYLYNQHGQLLSANYPNGKTIEYNYSGAGVTQALISRLDSAESLLSEWRYDNDGQVIERLDRGGRNRTYIERSTTGATVTYPDGRIEQFKWLVESDQNDVSSTVSAFSCNGCVKARYRTCSVGVESDNALANAPACVSLPPDNSAQFQDPSYEVISEFWRSLTLSKDPSAERSGYFSYQGEYPHAKGKFPIKLIFDRHGFIKDMTIGKQNLQVLVLKNMGTMMNPSVQCDGERGGFDSPTFMHSSLYAMGTGGEPCAVDWMVGMQFKEMLEAYSSW